MDALYNIIDMLFCYAQEQVPGLQPSDALCSVGHSTLNSRLIQANNVGAELIKKQDCEIREYQNQISLLN